MNIRQLNEALDRVLNEDKKDSYKYQGYTFIPKGILSMSFYDATNYTRYNPKLNIIFDRHKGTWNYDDFYQKVPTKADIFSIKELDNILVIPATNYLFEWTGDNTTYSKVR